MLRNTGFFFLLASVSAAGAQEAGSHPGKFAWASREARPAVVNPVVRTERPDVLSLRGEWVFATDPQTNGLTSGWMRPGAVWRGARSLQVPGCWEAQGVGEPGISRPWDMNDRGPYPLRHVYMGSAWYRRSVPVPAAWRDKRVWLKIGGVRAQGWFWVNGKPVTHNDSYCGVYKFDVTDCVVPGQQATVAALVRNDLPSRKGSSGWRHRAGGLYRDVEFEATPDTRIDNAWVAGDFEGRAAVVRATIAYATEAGRLKNPVLRVKIVPHGEDVSRRGAEARNDVVFAEGKQTAEAVVRVPLDPFQPWSPEQPHLYVAEITLCEGETPVHSWRERFGVRKLEVRGDRFFLNGAPFFMRGYGDDHIYPVTLISPASREDHLKRLTLARASGFNYVRLHTHCEVPEFFEAADEAGILVQAELPYNHAKPGEAFPSDPKRDLSELITHYQRYVSLATCCMGNEGGFPSPLDKELYALSKRLNPALLVLHHDGGNNTPENSDFKTGPTTPWNPGTFASAVPFVAHEYLNLTVKADPRLDDRFTGAYLPSLAALGLDSEGIDGVRAGFPSHMSDLDSAPRDQRSFENELRRLRLNRAWGDACVDAGHALQRFYQKQGIENARLDPACDGYSFWTIVDVLYQAQGLFNVFWEPKSGGAKPADFRVFNGPTALLKRDESRSAPIAVSGQTLNGAWRVSHYGERTLSDVRLTWTLRAGGEPLAGGTLASGDVAIGAVRDLGAWTFTVPPLARPVHAVLEALLTAAGAPPVRNQWDYWFFPARDKKSGADLAATRRHFPTLAKRYSGLAPAGTPEEGRTEVLLASEGDPEVMPALENGRRVVLLDRCAAPDNVRLGWWLFGNQTGTAMARHPAFGDFPHDGTLSPLWFHIVKRPELLQPDDGFCGAEPLMVGDGFHGYSLYLCQARVGKGRLLRACGLDVLSGPPEGAALLDALLAYARSDAFAPAATLDPEALKARWLRHQRLSVGLNGWARTVTAAPGSPFHTFLGSFPYRALPAKGQTGLEWETAPVAVDDPASPRVTLRWLHLTRVNEWRTKETRPLTLHMNGKACLRFTADIIRKAWRERQGEASLDYQGLDFTQNSSLGLMELSVPRSWTRSGASCVLSLTAEQPAQNQLSTGVIEVNSATLQPQPPPNGWPRTVSAGDCGRYRTPKGAGQLDVARAMAGKNELVRDSGQ